MLTNGMYGMYGLYGGLGNLAFLDEGVSRSITAENRTGEKGKGAMATVEGAAWKAAEHLGQGWKVSPYDVIQPGMEYCLADISGQGVIESIWIGGNISRDYILRFYWDGCETPSVECPLAEFFAYGWQKDTANNNPTAGPFYQLTSLPVCVNPNRSLNCFWPMPFQQRCKITFENRSENECICYYQINYCLREIPKNAGYFHAQFRQKMILDYKEEYIILDGVEGKGRYVGTALFVGLNGAGNWWGEGEVKFFLDGDTVFPTICGTGTEDYFCGSYDWEVDRQYTTYNTPYAGMYQVIQSDNVYNHQQRFFMYRSHIMDPIRFTKDIKVTIQDLGWGTPKNGKSGYLARRDDFASVAYWYKDSPGLNRRTLPPADEMRII